jgi:hypothetical protein
VQNEGSVTSVILEKDTEGGGRGPFLSNAQKVSQSVRMAGLHIRTLNLPLLKQVLSTENSAYICFVVIICLKVLFKRRCSSVDIVTDYGLDDRGSGGFDSRRGMEIVLLSTASRPDLGPTCLLYNGYWGVVLRG